MGHECREKAKKLWLKKYRWRRAAVKTPTAKIQIEKAVSNSCEASNGMIVLYSCIFLPTQKLYQWDVHGGWPDSKPLLFM